LNGALTGTISHEFPTCAACEGVAVALSQEGGAVSNGFRTSCRGMLDLHCELNGDSVSGTLYRLADSSSFGQTSGTVSRTSIRITTWGPQAREDDGPRVRAVVNVIDLTR
jgi:hypothetical protein